MAIYPHAVVKTVGRFRTPMRSPRRVNLHTAVSDARSLFGWFASWGRPCSHFYVREDGTVEQYVDTRFRAAADLQGNSDTISIETWDGYRRLWSRGEPGPWNEAQVAALVRLLAWIFETHPTVPMRLATDSRPGTSSHGISYHRLGCDPYRVEGGLRYSNAYGKVCPGSARIAQIPGLLGGVIRGLVPASRRDEARAPLLLVDGDFGPYTIRALQRALRGVGEYLYAIDGDFGPESAKAYQRWLIRCGFYRFAVDGDFGYHSTLAEQRWLRSHGLYGPPRPLHGRRDGETIAALQAALNRGVIS